MTKIKKIKILTRGVITSKNFVYGPVLTPYPETLDNIYKLLADGVSVVEVTDDGKEIPLDTMNYDKDHSKAARMIASEKMQEREIKERRLKNADNKAKAMAEVEKKDNEPEQSEPVLDTSVVVEPPVQNNNFQHGKNKKNKKNHSEYKPPVTAAPKTDILRPMEEDAVQK